MEKYDFNFKKPTNWLGNIWDMGYHCSESSTRAFWKLSWQCRSHDHESFDFIHGRNSGTEQQICGAVSGGLIVLGSLYGRSEPDVNDDFLTRDRAGISEKLHQHLRCKQPDLP